MQSAPSLFDVLKPTDIVVVGREPASVRTIDGSGSGVGSADQPWTTRQLLAHDHHHTDTVLRVWTESDTIEYQCDVPFEIVQVQKAGWRIYDAPDNPFDRWGGGLQGSKGNVTWTENNMGLDVKRPAGDG